ncbi:hypothetical protein RchiOBHm_Chr4g0401241 [Rosa chinensis]|uniref:Uncharacterized protein n=1 Tax=Rosa chinensis TaxID=74649 RepID=A0A2P6QT14_ROSCH|nr:hypothetical protein RchiOBHm_Chr4g0401241 [Rosa chinensis]
MVTDGDKGVEARSEVEVVHLLGVLLDYFAPVFWDDSSSSRSDLAVADGLDDAEREKVPMRLALVC